MTAITEYKRWLLHMGSGAHKAIVERGMERRSALEYVAEVALEAGNNREFCALTPSFALAWAECGFPLIEPSHRLAASMMATSMPAEYVYEFVRMPWRCFAIHVHPGLIDDEAALMFVINSRDNNRIRALSFIGEHMTLGDESSIADWNSIVSEKIRIGKEEIDSTHHLYESSVAAFNKVNLLGRLFVSVCAELNSQYASEHTAAKTRAQGRESEPRVVTHKLTRNVRVDVRRAVREYADGDSHKSPSVQVMVRGHWKLQPHGPGRAERKLLHIEPYWRGPDDAPIAVRSHILGTPEDAR